MSKSHSYFINFLFNFLAHFSVGLSFFFSIFYQFFNIGVLTMKYKLQIFLPVSH